MEMSHQEINTLKSVFKSNGYPKNFIDLCIKIFLDKLLVKNKVSLAFPELQLVYVLSYTCKSFFDLRTRLRRTIEENVPFCKISEFLWLTICKEN